MKLNFKMLMKYLKLENPFINAVRSAGSEEQVPVDTADECDRLRLDLFDMEYALGAHLVRQHRFPVKSRFKTIAMEHRLSARNKTSAQWVCEARALARYFTKQCERDSEAAITLLMPFEMQYQKARNEQLHGKGRSKPTVGQAGGMRVSQKVGQ